AHTRETDCGSDRWRRAPHYYGRASVRQLFTFDLNPLYCTPNGRTPTETAGVPRTSEGWAGVRARSAAERVTSRNSSGFINLCPAPGTATQSRTAREILKKCAGWEGLRAQQRLFPPCSSCRPFRPCRGCPFVSASGLEEQHCPRGFFPPSCESRHSWRVPVLPLRRYL